jgi:hypothetical protein
MSCRLVELEMLQPGAPWVCRSLSKTGIDEDDPAK